MNILYVEDNPDDAKLVERFVVTTGHHLVTAENLEQAYEIMSTGDVGLVLLDIVFNKRPTGYKFASDLRANDFKQPIVAVTALNTAASLEACEEAGINFVLAKPYSILQLAEMISRYTN
jgi:two-component system, HptB-dependent secretion and biofilm response regulator